jgi:hypothetical protein
MSDFSPTASGRNPGVTYYTAHGMVLCNAASSRPDAVWRPTRITTCRRRAARGKRNRHSNDCGAVELLHSRPI